MQKNTIKLWVNSPIKGTNHMNILQEHMDLFRAVTPHWMDNKARLKSDGSEPTKKEWEEALMRLFMFTAGLYTGSKLNVEKLEELIRSGNKE